MKDLNYLKRMFGNKSELFEKIFPYLTTAIFITLSIILIYHHEFWRDEIISWHFGSESTSFSEFLRIVKQDGTNTYTWFTFLYFISHFITSNIESMKVVHLAISTVSVFLILKYAPFNKIIRTMIVFGYFFFYEYSIISRNYALGILFIIIFCILYKTKYRNMIFLGIVLFLMGQGSILSFLTSIVLFLMLIFELIIDWKKIRNSVNKIHLIVLLLIVISGMLFVYWQLGSHEALNIAKEYVTPDAIFDRTIGENIASMVHVSKGIFEAYLPIPKISLNFWETNLVFDFISKYQLRYTFLIALALLVAPLIIIKRRIILPYVTGSIGILILAIYFIKAFYIRHFGHLFVLFIACIWLSNIQKEGKYLINIRNNFYKRFQAIFLAVILIPSIIGSSVAFYYDWKYPFSSGKAVAKYIEENFNLDEIAIVGYKDNYTETIAGYLDKDIYYPQQRKFSKFVSWHNREGLMSYKDIFSKAYSFTRDNKKVLVIIDKYHIEESEIPGNYFFKKLDTKFDNSIVPTENYCLYLFDKEYVLNSSELVYKIDKSNFENYWKVLQQCEFDYTDYAVWVKVYGDDPYFENKFPIEFQDNQSLVVFISIISDVDAKFQVYYGRAGIGYREEDSSIFNLTKGDNSIYIKIPYSENLESIRVDPINIRNDCFIKKIEMYNFSD